jgi:hypothetical protein
VPFICSLSICLQLKVEALLFFNTMKQRIVW